MKILRYLSYFSLFVLALLVILLAWPKGSLEKQLANKNVPAIGYGIIEDGILSQSHVIGELEASRPAPKNTIFNVASVSKPVFSLVVLKLIDAGVIGLDEPLHPYWTDPDLADDPRHKLLTARILLSHQSGFPNWRWNTADGKLAFSFDPGTAYQYSGEGMEYLRKAIEQKTQQKLNYLADSLLFDPLKMKDSHLIWDKSMDESRFAKWHNAAGEQYELKKRTEAVASDDLMTTVADLSTFARYIIEKKGGLSDELYQEMISPQVNVNGRTAFGLGWELVPDLGDGEFALVHGGSDIGVRARLVVLPQSKRAFIAFVNGDGGQQIIDRLMVKEFEPGKHIIQNIYAPWMWRIVQLPFSVL